MITLTHAVDLTEQWTGQRLAQVSLRAAAARGALRAEKVGRDWLTTERDLRAYLKGRPAWFQLRKTVSR